MRGGGGMSGRPNLRGAALAWAAPLTCEAAALVRSVVLARLLGAEELGRMMMLALMIRLVEMAGDLSIERLMAQAPDGGERRFLAAMHGVALLRAGALAALCLIAAAPLALLLPDGPAMASYAALALVPLARGGIHLDYRRRERDFDYRGVAIVECGAAVAMLLAAPLAVALIGDHRAFVPVALAQAAAQTALSHAIARERWSAAFDRETLTRIVVCGLPLLGNAVLMFLIFHVDRVIIAAYFDWSDVGRYAVALQLSLLPAQIAGRAANSLLAPRFRLAIASGDMERQATRALRSYALLATAFLLAYAALARFVMVTVYGPDFAIDGGVLVWLGLAASVRILRTPLSQQAVAVGETSIPARANLYRAAVLPVALAAAALGAPLWALAATGAAGEILAAIRAAQLVRGAGHRPSSPAFEGAAA